MENEIHNARQTGKPTPELKKLLETKNKRFPLQLNPGNWHALMVVVECDEMRAFINVETVGALMSPGMGSSPSA